MIRAASGTCVRPIAGEEVSGDACLVEPWSRGVVVVVSDGLGHGPAAAEASRVLLAHVRSAIEMPLEQIFAGAHRALARTRGVVATLARIDEGAGKIELAGIGNVTTRVVHGLAPPLHVLVPAGVLGSGVHRPTRTQSLDFAVGDLLVMHTDGIRSRFDLAPLLSLAPDELARAVVGLHGKTTDDAACAVVLGATARSTAGRDEGDRLAMPIRLPGDAECCAIGARVFAGRLGFTVRRQWEVSIAVSELATNVLRHADEGTLTLSSPVDPPERVVVEIVDRARDADGPPGGGSRSARRGLGVGLECVHRMMDHVAIETSPQGRRVVAWKYR
jgi:negative regulator of sigma-B (phosphoserine phosphatase)